MFANNRVKAQSATSAAKRPEPPKATTPWKPADLCAPPAGCVLPPGWGGRWVRADNKQGDDRIAAKADEGWQVWDKTRQPWAESATKDGRAKHGGSGDANVDGTDISSASRRRNLVYMVLSPEKKAARERYLWEKSNAAKDGLHDPQADALLAEKSNK